MEDAHSVRKGTAIMRYFKNSVLELRKVTWPTKQQAVAMTTLVIIVSLVTTAFIAVLDYAMTRGYEQLLNSRTTTSTTSVEPPPVTIPAADSIPANPQ